ncbi:hypothetical protein H0H93_005006 [Arthromyces matolae]|nr:hypothetical protein H0H93_005006 [Arthromyces matolae]
MTAASTKCEGNYVISLLEGRGVAREVGMAALDKDTGKVMLVQLADCQTYVKTLHQMHLHPPSLVLVPDTFLSAPDVQSGSGGKTASLLVQFIEEEFPGARLEPVARRYWNDSAGLEFILQLCVEDDERAGTVIAVSNKYYALSATSALFKHAESKMNTRFAAGSLCIRYVPVEGTMMIDPDTAKNLELVENMRYKKSAHCLFGTEDKYTEVRDALRAFNKMDFDKLIVSLAAQEVRVANTAKVASARTLQMLNLRNVVKNLPLLQKALNGSQAQLLRIIHDLISDERLAKIENLVNANLNEDGAPAKAQRNRLLDVARETYKENVGDIFQLNRTLSEEHELPLTLVYQEGGFVFTLKKTELVGELPKGFVNVSCKKGKWVFTSLAHSSISEFPEPASSLTGFKHYIFTIRPEFTGTLAIKSGRHPVLETIQSAGTLVPNDVYCDDSSSFQIIHGPNMSGKSTYLKQIGLLTVMALSGCFVPAEYASFRIHDALLTRLSNDDDLEKSLSTFASEMASSAMIIGLATPKSLVLVDELGRGTSPRDGLGISHAIAEELIALKEHFYWDCLTSAIVDFSSHFKELTTTLSRQPTVIKIVDGAPEDSNHYGLELARLADLPEDVLTEGKRVAEALAALHAKHEEESESSQAAVRRRALLRLRTQLTQAYEHSALPDEELHLLLSEGLVNEDVLRTMEGKVHKAPSTTMHYLEQPFVLSLAKSKHRLWVWDGQKLSCGEFQWFKDCRTRPFWNPYTGRFLARFERQKRERVNDFDFDFNEDKDDDTVVVRVLKILEPIQVTVPGYDMHVPIPREGGLLQTWRAGNALKIRPITLDSRFESWMALKKLMLMKPLSAEIRFRLFPSIINKDGTQPLDFTQTTDLTTPEHTPWSLTLFQLTRPQYKPFSDLLLSEKLVSSTLLDAMTGKMDRNVKRPLHYLEQPFVMDMEKVGHSLAVWDGERVSQVRFEWPPFRDHSLKANPYTGILLLRLEQATVEQAQRLLKGEVNEVARKENKSLAAAAVIRVLKILQPIRVVIPDYNMRLPIPREGELLKGLAKAKKGFPEKNAPIVIDLRNPVGVWKALKALLAPMDSNLR